MIKDQSKRYPTTRISLKAKKKLKELAEKKGMSHPKVLDWLLKV